MSLNEQEKQIAEFGKKNGKTKEQVLAAIALYRERQQPQSKPKGSFLSDIGEDAGQTFQGLKDVASKTSQKMKDALSASIDDEQGLVRGLGQAFGAGAGGISEGIGEVVKGGVKAVLSPDQEDALKTKVGKIAAPIVQSAPINTIIERYNSLDAKQKRDADALLGVGSLVTELIGGGTGVRAGKSSVRLGMETAEQALRGVGRAVEPVKGFAQGTGSVIADVVDFTKGIPSRIAVNTAERQAARQSIKSLNNPVLEKAAKEGIEVTDLTTIKSFPKSQKPALRKLADTVIDFSSGNTKVNPFEVVGKPIVARLKTLDNQVKGYAKQLDTVAKKLEGQAVQNMNIIKQSVNEGLDNLKVGVDIDGKLNFIGSNLEGIGRSGNIVENIYKRIAGATDAAELHRLKKFIDENVSYGKRVEGLSGEAERLLKTWRRAIDGTLDAQFPAYNKVNTELSKRIQPLNDLKDLLKSSDNLDTDLLSQKAGILARRITSAAPSNPEIKQILRNLDKFTKGKGKTLLSTESLQDFYNILNKYYDIAPKTGFQNLTKEGVESAQTAMGLITDTAKEFAGKSKAVRRQALEDALKELLK